MSNKVKRKKHCFTWTAPVFTTAVDPEAAVSQGVVSPGEPGQFAEINVLPSAINIRNTRATVLLRGAGHTTVNSSLYDGLAVNIGQFFND